MSYRDECLLRIAAARSRIDDALRTAPTEESLRGTWDAIWGELKDEQPPAADRVWLEDRLDDLRTHVNNAARWREWGLSGAGDGPLA